MNKMNEWSTPGIFEGMMSIPYETSIYIVTASYYGRRSPGVFRDPGGSSL